MTDGSELAVHGAGVGVGLLVAGWAAQTALWTGYMRANPATGTVSGTPGGGAITALLFVAGITLAYAAGVRGLARAR